MDRLVAVDGKEVDGCSHDQVVDRIRQSGNKCCLLVVDKDTDQMYKQVRLGATVNLWWFQFRSKTIYNVMFCPTQGRVSPMLFWEERNDSLSPPSYTEALKLPSTPVQETEEELKPKLCKMEKSSAGYGFHLNGIQGVCGQYIKEVRHKNVHFITIIIFNQLVKDLGCTLFQVVRGGVAERAGLEDDDIVVEVNRVNVEQSSHDEVVGIIRSSGSSLEMLVAKKSVYDQLKAKGVPITRQLLGEASYVEVHSAETPEACEEVTYEEIERPETPTERARERVSRAVCPAVEMAMLVCQTFVKTEISQ